MAEVLIALGELHGFIQFCLIMLTGCVIRLTYRAIMVCARGWPPPHLDADGDRETKDATP